MHQPEEIRESLRGWILSRAGAQTGRLADDAPILAEGLLSSLDVVELVLFVESLRGEEVDADAIEPEALASIDALYATFFGDEKE